MTRVSTQRLAALLLLGPLAACGKKGPPLVPLSLAAASPGDVAARRLGDTVYLQMVVPNKSASGPGPFSVDHLDVYAVTLAPDAPTPANRDLLTPRFVIARIPVRPPVDPDAVVDEAAAKDTRPQPGDAITFVETITPALLTPQQVTKPAPAAKPPATVPVAPQAAAAAPAAPAPAPAPAVLSRLYVVQAVAKNGTRGNPSARASVPLLAAPAAARAGTGTFDATSVTVTWEAPALRTDEAPGVGYNVYAYSVPAAGSGAAAGAVTAPVPLNAAPLATTSFSHPGAEPDKQQCFVVRSVATVGAAAIESDPSDPICVTPRDTFPPAAPKGLAAVGGSGVVNLIWDANTEADLGGYLVLRGTSADDTLQPLTAEPIHDTRYVDRAVTAGVTYFYAVVAIDRATPPNRSPLSNKVQETAR